MPYENPYYQNPYSTIAFNDTFIITCVCKCSLNHIINVILNTKIFVIYIYRSLQYYNNYYRVSAYNNYIPSNIILLSSVDLYKL